MILADDFIDSLLERLRVDMGSCSRRRLLEFLCLMVCGAEGFPVLDSFHQPHHVPAPVVAGEGIRLRIETGGCVVNRVNILNLLSGQTRGVMMSWETLRRWRKLTGMFTRMVSRMVSKMVSGVFTRMFTRMFSRLLYNMVAI